MEKATGFKSLKLQLYMHYTILLHNYTMRYLNTHQVHSTINPGTTILLHIQAMVIKYSEIEIFLRVPIGWVHKVENTLSVPLADKKIVFAQCHTAFSELDFD